MKNLKSRIISMLIVISMIATGTAPKVFAEVFNGSPVSEQAGSSLQNDEQTTSDGSVYITGEVEELRTENSKTYEKSDGSRVAVVLEEPVHFYDENKEVWQEYDNRLSYNEKTEAYESNETGSDMKVSLPKNIDEQSNIEVEADGYKVSITPIDIKSSASKKINDKKNIKSDKVTDLKKYDLEDYVSDSVLDGKVEYSQDDDTNIEYIFSGSKLKENIVLSKIPDKKQKYSFRINADGLTAKQNKDNSIKLLNEDKKEVFTIPAPYMYDEGFEFSDNIKTNLKKDGSGYILTYTPNYKWLSDENRTYPVTIDPTITSALYADKIVDTSVFSAAPYNYDTFTTLYVGALSNRDCIMDAYINFKGLPVMDKLWTISNAKLNLKTATNVSNKINAYKITSDWEASNIKSNLPSVSSTILDVCYIPAIKNARVNWDITNAVNDWYCGGKNYGIQLSSPYAQNSESIFYSSETANAADKPYLSIEYKTISAMQLENSRTIDIGRAGTVTINDFTGNVVLTREDIGFDGNVMPVNISMIYNLNYFNSTEFGFGFKTNYSQLISFRSDMGRNEFYEYYCGDGSVIYFDYDDETGEYIDRSERGYSFKYKDNTTSGYNNIIVTDPNGDEHYFDQYGRLSKIVGTQGTARPEITVVYTGDYTNIFEIDYIIDGSGRKYDFNYTNGKLTDISYYGKSSSVLRKVSYEYSGSNLKKVTYPDGKSVSYSWNTGNLVSVTNTDGYRVNFSYTGYDLSKQRRISSIKEYGSNGTKGTDISVTYSPYQTKYKNNNTGDTETLVFSNEGDLISTYNSQGQVTANEYAKGSGTHGVNSLVNTFEHKKSETNLIKNGEFENNLSGWTQVNGANHLWSSYGHPGNGGSIELKGNPDAIVFQEIDVSGTKGDTYDIGGWVNANASPQYPINITVSFYNATNSVGSHIINFNPYCTNWQYVMKNVEADGDYTHFFVTINYSNQINCAYFDGVVVYKAENAVDENVDSGSDNDTNTDEEIPEPTTSTDSDGSTTTVDENDGINTITVEDKYGNNLSNATVVDGVTMSDSNEYSSSGNYLKSSTDSSGVKTSYNYNENTGNLYTVNVNNNPTNYSYDLMGNITSASQNVSGLSNGTSITNSYDYDSGDRLSRITHNGFNYYFGYTEFGLLESIISDSNNLINYGYDSEGVLTSASYGNGQTIDYEYNDDGNSSAVSQDGKILYGYNYDEDGVLTSVDDNTTGRVINYLTNSDGQDIIEETGDGIYHKYYETENEKVETIDNKTRTTETITDDDYTTKTRYLVNNYYSTFFKNTDKFGRTASERVIRNNKTSDYDIYNKEYSYESSGSGKTSERVSQITYTGGYNRTIKYGYDASGNISEIDGIKYGYDEAGQLISETNEIGRLNRKYTYDKGGNITELKKYVNGKLTQTNTYTYGNSDWKDLLTAYNGNKITYDEIGNPLTYYNGMKFSWTMGRRLKSVKNGNANISYAYNAEGLRTRKVISGIQFNYYWNGDKLTGQTWQGNTLYFYYDKDGNPIGFDYNNNHYYYITNLQGDIIAILDVNGNLVAEYEYDSWGNCTIPFDTNDIADINPLRYRGYYYDSDTNLYYLQSRYYDANIGRFINADSADMISKNALNLFSYCACNPIMYVDSNGYYRAYIFSNAQFYNESKYIRDSLKRYFKNNLSSNLYKLNSAKKFIKKWNAIKSADVIVLNAHADQKQIFDDLTRNKIFNKLCILKCKALIILGCNAGHYNYIWNNVAYNFSLSITGTVVASDGTIYSESTYPYNSKIVREPYFESRNDKTFLKIANNKRSNNWGWVLYRSVYGKKYVTTTWYSTNLYTITMPSILNYLKSCGLVKF